MTDGPCCIFSFLRTPQTVFQSGCIILHFHQQLMRVSVAPHFCTSICCHQCSGFGRSNRCLMIFHSCVNLHLITDDVEHLFMHFICRLYIFFGEMSIKVFGPFLIRFFVFLLLSFKISLYILDNCPLSDVSLQIFSPSLWLLFLFS